LQRLTRPDAAAGDRYEKFLLPTAHDLMPTLRRVSDGESRMAKGQMKSNKEKRKPKKEKAAKGAPTAGGIGSGGKK